MDPLSLKIKHGFSTEVRHVMLSFITLPLRKDEKFPLRTCKMKIIILQISLGFRETSNLPLR